MLLAIPVSGSDVALLKKRVELIKQFGPYPTHVLAMFPDVGVTQPAKEAFEELAPLFARAEFIPLNLNGSTGWPLASNKHFKLVAQAVHALNIREAFYFFELDNVPRCKGWLDAIHAEYVHKNKPYMGCVVPTRGFVNGQPVLGEPHMVGTGIYPPNYAAYSPKLKHIDRVAAFTNMPLEPFDVAIRHETVPFAHATKLIQHLWRTCHYRKEGDQIVCDDMPGIGPNESHKAPVSPEAVVVHGCKDDSFPDLLREGDPIVSPTLSGALPGANGSGSLASPVAGVAASDGPPVHKTFLGVQITKELSQRKMRVVDLAKVLNVSKEDIKREVNNPVNKLAFNGSAGWVKTV